MGTQRPLSQPTEPPQPSQKARNMKYFPYKTPGFFGGLGLVGTISAIALWLAGTPSFQSLRLSPLIIGILSGTAIGLSAVQAGALCVE